MNKWTLFILAGAVVLVIAIGMLKDRERRADGEPDYRNATYSIDGVSVPMHNGMASSSGGAGATMMTTSRIFGNEATGDLNGDGRNDIAFLLTQNTGGSGTFFYVAVALNDEDGYRGTNAVLLGDRIAPQSTTIKDGIITVNYADRKASEPMTAVPTQGVSRYFRVVNGTLVEGK